MIERAVGKEIKKQDGMYFLQSTERLGMNQVVLPLKQNELYGDDSTRMAALRYQLDLQIYQWMGFSLFK